MYVVTNSENIITKLKKHCQNVNITSDLSNVDIFIANNEEDAKQCSNIPDSCYVLVNCDLVTNFLCEKSIYLISFGLNSKATVTTSSIEDDCAIICIQRNIVSFNNIFVEPQEFKINLCNNDDILDCLAVVAVMLAVGTCIEEISKIQF